MNPHLVSPFDFLYLTTYQITSGPVPSKNTAATPAPGQPLACDNTWTRSGLAFSHKVRQWQGKSLPA